MSDTNNNRSDLKRKEEEQEILKSMDGNRDTEDNWQTAERKSK